MEHESRDRLSDGMGERDVRERLAKPARRRGVVQTDFGLWRPVAPHQSGPRRVTPGGGPGRRFAALAAAVLASSTVMLAGSTTTP